MWHKKRKLNGLTFHHIGVLVDCIENSIEHYSYLFGEPNVSNITFIESQSVKVCFVKISNESYIELVEPVGEESVVYKLLKKRVNYYHIGYKVVDIFSTVIKLEELNYKPLKFFESEAFEGKECIFLFSPEAHLIELIQQ